MIEESYVLFETAQMLKEAGFEADCDFIMDDDGKRLYRPTQALAARWLREKHGIHVCIDVNASGWYYDLCKSDNGTHILWSSYQGQNDGGEWDSYEEAIEEGLKRGLELIKK